MSASWKSSGSTRSTPAIRDSGLTSTKLTLASASEDSTILAYTMAKGEG